MKDFSQKPPVISNVGLPPSLHPVLGLHFGLSPASVSYTHLIAYGEQELTTQTQGQDGGLLEFEIPLDYRSLTRIPSYIPVANMMKPFVC